VGQGPNRTSTDLYQGIASTMPKRQDRMSTASAAGLYRVAAAKAAALSGTVGMPEGMP